MAWVRGAEVARYQKFLCCSDTARRAGRLAGSRFRHEVPRCFPSALALKEARAGKMPTMLACDHDATKSKNQPALPVRAAARSVTHGPDRWHMAHADLVDRLTPGYKERTWSRSALARSSHSTVALLKILSKAARVRHGPRRSRRHRVLLHAIYSKTRWAGPKQRRPPPANGATGWATG